MYSDDGYLSFETVPRSAGPSNTPLAGSEGVLGCSVFGNRMLNASLLNLARVRVNH